ncbi:Chitinase-3-like protein 1 [Folsomia candida]|uniref:Chitinase-3-like protein 1 n=1 Tax=Folsomia candida TaxID=158441 RepID=A0A226DPX2_FOLCA|nr:Chitinase-3-like protein 1 [Folsomia candida]
MWTPATTQIGHHSPLFPSFRESDKPDDQKLTVAYAVNHFLKMGNIAEKLVLGISAHARTYAIGGDDYSDFYHNTAGPGPAGSYTRQESFLAFFEICDEMNKHPEGWQFRYDHEYKIAMAVDAFDGNYMVWIGYDNEISAIEKVDFAMSNGLGGMMIDSLDLDDYNNFCKGWVRYPLTAAIKERLGYWEAKY